VDKVLATLLDGVSRATIQRWIGEGRVLLDGVVCRPKDDVRAGNVLDVTPSAPLPSAVEPDATVPFGVLYEDDALIVVDKPPGVVVHPARGNWSGTLVGGLLSRPGFERAPSDERDPLGPMRPGIVHRLDKDTSGILVVAKTEVAREGLKAQLAAHSMRRIYRGITLGAPTSRIIKTLYGRSRASRIRFTSRTEEGRSAVTHVTLEELLAGGRAALVRCQLETGRTHQIRVHLSEQTKTPILADRTYGRAAKDTDIAAIEGELGRQALHAQSLGFQHPVTGEALDFESPLPEDMSRALTQLRALA
jgi:23S rRNA pseudouridine1911/1915/1917 synthase